MEDSYKDQTIESAEIMEMIFNYLDLARLKRCRLVCKSWNAEACRKMRKISFVRVYSSSATVPLKHQVLKSLVDKGKELKLPSPFHCLSIKISCAEVAEMLKVLTENQFLTLRVIIEEMPEGDQPEESEVLKRIEKSCHEFLEYCSASVTELKWDAVDGFVIPRLNCDFPNLKRIDLPDLAKAETEWIPWFASIVNSSPKLIELSTVYHESNMEVLQQCNLTHLEDLKIFDIKRDYLFPTIKGLDMPVLETLEFFFSYEKFSDPFVGTRPLICDLISEFAATLRKLTFYNSTIWRWSHRFDFAQLPVCPLLTDLRIRGMDSFRIDNAVLQKVPALRSLSVTPLVLPPADEVIPFHSLEKLTLRDNTNIYTLLPQLSLQFPDASTWEVTSYFLEDLLRTGKTPGNYFHFNQIHKIHMWIAGWFLDDWEPFLPNELPPSVTQLLRSSGGTTPESVSMAALFTGLFYLKSLKHLEIVNYESWLCRKEWNISLIPLELIPSLESFSFYWTKHLDPVTFAEKLRHLNSVTVINGCITDEKDKVDSFFRALPVARCGCKEGDHNWRYFYPT